MRKYCHAGYTDMFFSPVCILIWPTRSPICEKVLSHRLHWYGFSPLCIFIWPTRLSFCEKAFSHRLHWYGFSPLCPIMHPAIFLIMMTSLNWACRWSSTRVWICFHPSTWHSKSLDYGYHISHDSLSLSVVCAVCSVSIHYAYVYLRLLTILI